MRKLASVQIIKKLEPIDGADFIELATVLGWHVVVKKDEFHVGDLCVYFEIDSLLPEDNPVFDFLKNSKGKQKALKTKKLKGVVSQGLVMPCSILPIGETFHEGDDVTEILKVKKYEPPEIDFYKGMDVRAMRLSTFPAFIPKTDETRVQVLQEQLNKANGQKFVVTEKIDGTSFTSFIRDGKFGICSRNMEVSLDVPSPYSDIAIKYNLKEKFEKLRDTIIPYDFAIQGEIIGKAIQKNKYNLEGIDCKLFNFYNIDRQKDVGFFFSNVTEYTEFAGITLGIIAAELGMLTVPIIDDNFVMVNDIDKLVEYSKGKSVLYPEQDREGVVFRLKENVALSRYGERISFKAINPDFFML